MRICGVGTAFPAHYYSQEAIREALKRRWAGKLENPQILDRLHSSVGVKKRHLVLPIPDYDHLTTWGRANDAWIEAGIELGCKALTNALTSAALAVQDLGAIFFVTVTGVASPSIEGRMINRMGLPVNIKRIPIFGLGCVAGAAGIARAADYVKAFPDQAAALVSVELCSLTWREDDVSPANLISSGLFGDGAAAVIVAGREKNRPGPRIIATRSVFYPNTEDVMGWQVSEKGFRIVLSRSVPEVVEQHLAEDVDAFLNDNELSRKDIGAWIMHTGGPKVLQATENALGLSNGALEPSWRSLAEVGNLSSASVLHVLEDFMFRCRPQAGTLSLLAAMGPGFCSELVLLEW